MIGLFKTTIRSAVFSLLLVLSAHTQSLASEAVDAIKQLVDESCINCHAGSKPAGSFSVENLSIDQAVFQSDKLDVASWERMLRKIRAGQMPPPSESANEGSESSKLIALAQKQIEVQLDQRAKHFLPPSRSGLRRLTRIEYQNAIRDIIGINIDAAALLPKDESSHGFDNVTVSELSPAFIGRAVTAAQQISRNALGIASVGPSGVTVRIPANRTQESHVEGLPLGTRGGALIQHHFPQSGEYEFQIRLARDRDEKIEGLSKPAELDVLIDKRPMHRFEIHKPTDAKDHTLVDAHLKARLTVSAGQHVVGITFPQTSESVLEYRKQPFSAAYNHHRHPRIHPAIFEVSIVGPLENANALIPETQVTRKLFEGWPINPPAEDADRVAQAILARLARLAYRRPLEHQDLRSFTRYYDSAKHNGFAAGMELAISSILVNPNFLLRVEGDSSGSLRDPNSSSPDSAITPISEIELASRLSFFLWSSVPDPTLVQLAEDHQLRKPEVLASELQRMLQDQRADSLVTNFTNQWLYLRNLDSLTPDLRLYTDFDDNLRQAMRQETEYLVREVIRGNHSVLRLLESDHTYLNQRLAAHYEIPGVLGSHMRPVELPADSHRGGILRHASILSITSYATRTSPTIRGNWILENIVGTPPPPPPPNVPALKESIDQAALTTRQRLKIHRENEACASCHNLMDPIGFAFENYDALGRWREFEQDLPIDSSGAMPDGANAFSVAEIERNLLMRPELFVGTMTEKLVTFALGRGIVPEDGPHIRRIVREAAASEYRFAAIVESIVRSPIFQSR
jgi:Protein of unknown function (DUF1592)/Protein of unknown function (DUF1588)/Protein of unknown function (DUF1585)/Protein of unknown function (DUF1587)/Protein of unknown function (DUF1595)